MSDSVKAWNEMQEENKKIISNTKKAYKILVEYDIQDIEKAVEIYYKTNTKQVG
jgi:hypothetical protein